MRSTDDRQCPVLILANRYENILFLEEVNLLRPSLDRLISVTDCVLLETTLTIVEFLLHCLGLLLQLGEELWIKDVQALLLGLRNDIVLKEAEIKED